MAFSTFGKKRMVARVALLLVNILVLALSARVNEYQEYFYKADLLPMVLSVLALIYLAFSIIFDMSVEDPLIGRAAFELPVFGLFSIFWFAFAIFSTARWAQIPMACSSIPSTYPAEITWCKDVQALKAFVWIEWLVFLLTFLVVLTYVIKQHKEGSSHIWTTGLATYTPVQRPNIYGFDASYGGAVSSDMQYVAGGEKGYMYN